MTVFSDYEWLPWKFNTVPKGFWDDKENVKKYMNWLGNQLNVNTMEDWYRVTMKVKNLKNL